MKCIFDQNKANGNIDYKSSSYTLGYGNIFSSAIRNSEFLQHVFTWIFISTARHIYSTAAATTYA